MAILCIRWNYFDMIRNPSPITLLVLQNCIIIHRKSTKGSDPYKVAFMVNKKMQMLKRGQIPSYLSPFGNNFCNEKKYHQLGDV